MMTDLSVFGAGVLALMAVWSFVLRPSIQDAFKDALFDVRDNLREHFAERGQLHTPAYCELRDTMNGYIRFVEQASFSLTYGFAAALSQRPGVADRYFHELDQRFDVGIPELTRLAKASRKRCSRIIHMYVFHSSFYSVAFLYLVIYPAATCVVTLDHCRTHAKKSWKAVRRSISERVEAREDETIALSITELFSQRRSFGLL